MTSERKLKAYVWHNDYDNGTCVIVWAETAGQAKRMVADESCLQFTEVRLRRLPWADNYRSMDEIPAEEYWEEGWYIPCNDCGKEVYEGEGVEVGKTVYCHDCWNARSAGRS